jgi:hypothetical protein
VCTVRIALPLARVRPSAGSVNRALRPIPSRFRQLFGLPHSKPHTQTARNSLNRRNFGLPVGDLQENSASPVEFRNVGPLRGLGMLSGCDTRYFSLFFALTIPKRLANLPPVFSRPRRETCWGKRAEASSSARKERPFLGGLRQPTILRVILRCAVELHFLLQGGFFAARTSEWMVDGCAKLRRHSRCHCHRALRSPFAGGL